MYDLNADSATLPPNTAAETLEQILASYNNVARSVDLCGPTSYAPVIQKSLESVRKHAREMSILFLITDGELSDEFRYESMQAIIDASSYPLSIVIIGVGDGPWCDMNKLSRHLVNKCKFDNLSFFEYHQLCKHSNSRALDFEFGLKAFMKLPQQLRILKQLNYI